VANEEHLAHLKQGVAAWNAWREEKYKEVQARLKRSKNRVTTQDQWRKKNPELWPDFREADLRRTDLCEADLFQADLYGAKLREADLSHALLGRANLERADLSGVPGAVSRKCTVRVMKEEKSSAGMRFFIIDTNQLGG
jgi:hypothetical protein